MPTPPTPSTVLSRPEPYQSQKTQVITSQFTNDQTTLKAAISRHIEKECVSFHAPGHKGRTSIEQAETAIGKCYASLDLTELPGLDDLSRPCGILDTLEKRAARVWGAHSSVLSVNGASAALIAALVTLARRGSEILVPRNCHRSVVSALVLTGLEPIWFDPVWEEAWGIWGPVTGDIVAAALDGRSSHEVAGVLIVSPTYAGALSKISEIASVCRQYNLPLVVDEAHGAHCLLPETSKYSALNCGADLVVHSLHKTIGALTQTGVVHITKEGAERFAFSADELRMGLNLVQTSSPSYIFLSSIDERISTLASDRGLVELDNIETLGSRLRDQVKQLKSIHIYEPSFGSLNSGVLLGCSSIDCLKDFLVERGIFPESIMGSGLLLLLGTGSNEDDITFLELALTDFDKSMSGTKLHRVPVSDRPEPVQQALSPRRAFYMPSRLLPLEEAIGEIAGECIAPCPPGWPIVVPGQRLAAGHLGWPDLPSVRVVRPS